MNSSPFLDASGDLPERDHAWEPIVITAEQIEAEIGRLGDLPLPANGRRRSYIRHPANTRSHGLAPGIEVALRRGLLPGFAPAELHAAALGDDSGLIGAALQAEELMLLDEA